MCPLCSEGSRSDGVTVKLKRSATDVFASDVHPMASWQFSNSDILPQKDALNHDTVHCAAADFAARAGVPVIRFMHKDYQPEEFSVNLERPAAFVFASEQDAQKFHYVEEAPRIVLPLARITSKKSQAYTEIPAALAKAIAKLQHPAPSPSALQVVGLPHLRTPFEEAQASEHECSHREYKG